MAVVVNDEVCVILFLKVKYAKYVQAENRMLCFKYHINAVKCGSLTLQAQKKWTIETNAQRNVLCATSSSAVADKPARRLHHGTTTPLLWV